MYRTAFEYAAQTVLVALPAAEVHQSSGVSLSRCFSRRRGIVVHVGWSINSVGGRCVVGCDTGGSSIAFRSDGRHYLLGRSFSRSLGRHKRVRPVKRQKVTAQVHRAHSW
jgi:hypothetical protein